MKKFDIVINKINFNSIISIELLSFLQKIFPGINYNKWKWKYKNSPSGRSSVWIGKVSNQIAVHYAFIILKFRYKNKIYKAAKAEGSLADINILRQLPKEERRLFQKTVNMALEDLQKQNIDFVYGFPNKMALKSQTLGGYDLINIPFNFSRAILNINPIIKEKIKNRNTLYKLKIYAIKLIWFFTIKQLIKYKANCGNNIKILNQNNKKDLSNFFSLWNNFNKNKMTIDRNWEYYNWRYMNNPYRESIIAGYYNKGKLQGVIVCSLEKNKLYIKAHIMDIIFINNNALKELIKWSLSWAFKKSAYSLDVWSEKSEESKYFVKYIKKFGFINNSNNKKNMIIKTFNKNLVEKNIFWAINRYLERI